MPASPNRRTAPPPLERIRARRQVVCSRRASGAPTRSQLFPAHKLEACGNCPEKNLTKTATAPKDFMP